MAKRVACGLAALAGLLAVGLIHAQEKDNKGIAWKYGLNFQVRKAGEIEFSDKTKKYGSEVFHDRDVNQFVFITETGTLSLGPGTKYVEKPDVKAPKLYHALEVRVRPAGKDKFDPMTPKFSMEVFKDVNSENLVYISENCSVAITPAGDLAVPEKVKDPVWFHGLELKVRKAGEKEFTDTTKKVGMEVYKDENTNQLVYVTEQGQIALVAAGSAAKPTDVKAPAWFHAFEIKVRKADEKEFGKDTKMVGVEVYKDENNGNLIFICETGSIAVVPGAGVSKPSTSKEPKWAFGRSFRVRKADELDFTPKTQKYGAEVYKDENSGMYVYVTETGAISVLTAK